MMKALKLLTASCVITIGYEEEKREPSVLQGNLIVFVVSIIKMTDNISVADYDRFG